MDNARLEWVTGFYSVGDAIERLPSEAVDRSVSRSPDSGDSWSTMSPLAECWRHSDPVSQQMIG
jgi:hypothetical protein